MLLVRLSVSYSYLGNINLTMPFFEAVFEIIAYVRCEIFRHIIKLMHELLLNANDIIDVAYYQ
jgi:hypothetical protein